MRHVAASLARGATTAADLVEEALDRIAATQSTLNAFRVVRADAARAEAAEADRRLRAGERLPVLGVPVAVKDDMDVAGEATEFGCAGAFEPKDHDGEVARRLRAAGAIIVGKTTSSELGQWPMAEGAAFGRTRNPWNLDRSPGGSSGGSAAAVAAGLVPAAVGSDGAGSVRIPAAWTGLVGIKPQRGRVSTWPDGEAFNGLTCYGPLAPTVGDAALLLDVLQGNRPGDLHRPPRAREPYLAAAERAEPGRLRVALSWRIPFSGAPASLDDDVRAPVERLAHAIAGLGHQVEEADPVYGAVGASSMPRSMDGVREWSERVPTLRCSIRARATTPARVACSAARCCGSRAPWSVRCERKSGASSTASTSCSRLRRPSRRCRSGLSTGLGIGRPTRSSWVRARTPGRGTCLGGRE